MIGTKRSSSITSPEGKKPHFCHRSLTNDIQHGCTLLRFPQTPGGPPPGCTFYKAVLSILGLLQHAAFLALAPHPSGWSIGIQLAGHSHQTRLPEGSVVTFATLFRGEFLLGIIHCTAILTQLRWRGPGRCSDSSQMRAKVCNQGSVSLELAKNVDSISYGSHKSRIPCIRTPGAPLACSQSGQMQRERAVLASKS